MREYLEYGFALRDAVVGDDKELRRSVDAPTISWIAAAVALGHAEGRPMNASKIADFLDLDRDTVRRKLEIMIALHVITRDGDDFFIEPTRAANVPPERRRRYARIFHDASRSLRRGAKAINRGTDNAVHNRYRPIERRRCEARHPDRSLRATAAARGGE